MVSEKGMDFAGDLSRTKSLLERRRAGEDTAVLLALPEDARAVLNCLEHSLRDDRIPEDYMKDGLTGLWRKEIYNRDIKKAARRAMQSQRRLDIPYLSLVIVDIDDFKSINDTCGYLKGDSVLERVAGLVRKSILRKTDRAYRWGEEPAAEAYRWGGEEITITLPGTDSGGALIVAERVRESISSYPWEEELGLEKGVTVSAGQSCYETEDKSFGAGADDIARVLFATANYALFCSKEVEEKNTVTGFHNLPSEQKREAYAMAGL